MHCVMWCIHVCVPQDEFSRLVEKWNAQRAQAVYTALVRVLYPVMQKELRNKLLMEAKDHVLQVWHVDQGHMCMYMYMWITT